MAVYVPKVLAVVHPDIPVIVVRKSPTHANITTVHRMPFAYQPIMEQPTSANANWAFMGMTANRKYDLDKLKHLIICIIRGYSWLFVAL